MNDISNEQNSMLRDGKIYRLRITKEIENCAHCVFNHLGGFCPGKCNSKNGNGYWVEAENFS